MIGRISSQLIGLFVDDEFLAAGILAAVAIVAILARFAAAPPALAGLLLVLSLPTILAASVLRGALRARRRERE
jgi:hypothetical protein